MGDLERAFLAIENQLGVHCPTDPRIARAARSEFAIRMVMRAEAEIHAQLDAAERAGLAAEAARDSLSLWTDVLLHLTGSEQRGDDFEDCARRDRSAA